MNKIELAKEMLDTVAAYNGGASLSWPAVITDISDLAQAVLDEDETTRLWTLLLSAAERTGHKPDPGESEFDFLQRLIGSDKQNRQ